MYKFLTKNGQLLAFGLGTLLTIIFYVSVSSGLEEFTELDLAKDPARFDTTIFNFGLMTARILTIVAGLIALVFGLYHTVTNPKGALKFVIGIAVFALIFFGSYSMSEGAVKESWAEKFAITPDISKFVEGSITATIALLGIAILIFILGEVRNFFK